MHLLLCNDDGYQAQGIQILAQELKALGHRITIVAPSGERSGQSHAVSFYTPIRVKKIDENTYAVDGTPADCASIGLNKILANDKPDFVVSGTNLGLNVGTDVNYSGTVGAATEAVLMGYKAIAVSLDTHNPNQTPQLITAGLKKAGQLVGQVLARHTELQWPKLEVLNINLPLKPTGKVEAADCSGASLYIPHVEELKPITSEQLVHGVYGVFLIGGVSLGEQTDSSQDVYLVQKNQATLSFITCKQSSTKNNEQLYRFAETLKI